METEHIDSLESLDNYFSERDNTQNIFYISEIPEVCKKYPCILGIDEAGRGPVLGPMLYGTAFCPINEQMILYELKCADSKALTEENRDEIFSNMLKASRKLGWAIEAISPTTISNCMLSRQKYSLNQISMDAAIKLIRTVIEKGVRVEHVFVDTVGKPETYQNYLQSLFPKLQITVAKKADSTYPVVSAASIFAKVSRDHFLKNWIFPEGLEEQISLKEIGSGYPNDPVTKSFLLNRFDPVFGYPQIVRFSWSTAAKALEDKAFQVDFPDQEDPKDKKRASTSTLSITSFFKVGKESDLGESGAKKPKKEHEFFAERFLSRKVEF